MTKIWGVRSGLIGDTIMALPSLSILEKLYPNSFKYWVIDKKCCQAAPLYLNHPLIDKVKVTDLWLGYGEEDMKIMSECSVVFNTYCPPVVDQTWFNKMSCVENTLDMAGLRSQMNLLSSEELYPKLYRWFPNPSVNMIESNHAYTFTNVDPPKQKFTIGIFPFAHYGVSSNRSPTLEWWNLLCDLLPGYEIRHFGWITEPHINNTIQYTHYSFFEQIKLALECDLVVGTDSGSMWVMGAYSHPAIHVMTYHMGGHNENPEALLPMNKNGSMLFNPKSCTMINPKLVLEKVKEYEENSIKQ